MQQVDLGSAIADAVEVVNAHAGQTRVLLTFSDDPQELDFVANSARLDGAAFVFQAGVDSYSGSVEELLDIRTEVIVH